MEDLGVCVGFDDGRSLRWSPGRLVPVRSCRSLGGMEAGLCLLFLQRDRLVGLPF